MDLRKVTCSECKSHLHYMENIRVEQNASFAKPSHNI